MNLPLKTILFLEQLCAKSLIVVDFWKWFWTPHFGNKKWLKCRHCDAKRHFMKRMDCKWSMIDWPKEKDYDKAQD